MSEKTRRREPASETMSAMRIVLAVIGVSVLAAAGAHLLGQPAPPRTHLVIVVDGLRPDSVTAEVMPRLTRLGQRGIVFTAVVAGAAMITYFLLERAKRRAV